MSTADSHSGYPGGAAGWSEAGRDGNRVYSPPLLEGRHVCLRAVTPEDYGHLRQIETSSPIAHRWRLRGGVPGPETWAQGLWQGVLAQFLVVERKRKRPVGLVVVYHANFQDGFASLGAARFDAAGPSPLMMLGVGLGLQYVFTCWNFRKLYLELPEYNYEDFAAGVDRLFEIEGRFRDHCFYAGEYWDQLTLAIYRER